MGIWSGTLRYHTLASSHLGSMEMMLDLLMLDLHMLNFHVDVRLPFDDVPLPSPPPHGANDVHRLQMIEVIMDISWVW